jgi:demethylspheroidene O-methyltransferase
MWPHTKRGAFAPGRARAATRLTWLDRCLGRRDRLLADPRFQRWAAGFPVTRKIAQRRAQALFDLCAGFVYSQVLFACVELRLFELLFERPHTLAELSRRLSLSDGAAARLLNAAASLRLVERRQHGRFGLGVLGSALLGSPAIAAMVQHHRLLYGDLRDPVSLLRGCPSSTALADYWPYAGAQRPDGLSVEQVADYSALMSASQELIAGDVLDACPLDAHRRLLDVGGGEGAFLIAAAARAPNLRLMLFDLPAVAHRARERLAAAGLSHRATVTSGDFLRGPLPRGADIVTLVRVVHDHEDGDALALLRNIRRALPVDGVLLIAEPMSGTAGPDVVADAYFGFYLLAMGAGRARTVKEVNQLLQRAGFEAGRRVATRRPMLTSVLITRPSTEVSADC